MRLASISTGARRSALGAVSGTAGCELRGGKRRSDNSTSEGSAPEAETDEWDMQFVINARRCGVARVPEAHVSSQPGRRLLTRPHGADLGVVPNLRPESPRISSNADERGCTTYCGATCRHDGVSTRGAAESVFLCAVPSCEAAVDRRFGQPRATSERTTCIWRS